MKYFVYILKSLKDHKRYIGSTDNVSYRKKDHDCGKVKSTCNRRPLKLIYTETFNNKKEALGREKFFKSGKGREYLKSKGL